MASDFFPFALLPTWNADAMEIWQPPFNHEDKGNMLEEQENIKSLGFWRHGRVAMYFHQLLADRLLLI